MEKYEKLKECSPEKFRKITGVKGQTLAAMALILVAAKNTGYRKSGRKADLGQKISY